MIFCTHCREYPYCNKQLHINADKCKDFQRKAQTNFKRIQSMSVDELADLLARRNMSCMPFCKECENCNQNTFKYPFCVAGIKRWLESEVSE